MDRRFEITCPDCGAILQIVLSEAGTICVSFLNINSDEETVQMAREIGYEFG